MPIGLLKADALDSTAYLFHCEKKGLQLIKQARMSANNRGDQHLRGQNTGHITSTVSYLGNEKVKH